MKNQYKTEYDNIKPTKTQKSILITKMQKTKTDKKVINFNRKVFTRAIAACLAIAVICTGFFFTKSTPKNSFTIIANAAEVQFLPKDAIGIFSKDDNINTVTYKVTDGTPEFTGTMSIFGLTEFAIQGSNIKSIAIHSNDEYCKILAEPIVESPNFDAEKYNIDDFSIGNSIKSEEGFIYENKNISGKTQTFKFDDLASFVVTPDFGDEEIFEWVTKIDNIHRRGIKIVGGEKKLPHAEIVKIDDKLTKESSELTRNCFEKMLRNATIDVTITFADGTTQTQTLDVDLVITDATNDIIYDAKYDNYSFFKYDSINCGINIAFRYAE